MSQEEMSNAAMMMNHLMRCIELVKVVKNAEYRETANQALWTLRYELMLIQRLAVKHKFYTAALPLLQDPSK